MPFSEKAKSFLLTNKFKKEVSLLEIGPKHGKDTEFILKNFNIKSYVIFELKEKMNILNPILDKLSKKYNINFDIIVKNIMYENMETSKFDIILCNGVLYHNAEQLKFLRKLYKMVNKDGILFIESAICRNPLYYESSCIEVNATGRQGGNREAVLSVPEKDILKNNSNSTMTFLPTYKAIKNMVLLVGFNNILFENLHSISKVGEKQLPTRYDLFVKRDNDNDDGKYYYEKEFRLGDAI